MDLILKQYKKRGRYTAKQIAAVIKANFHDFRWGKLTVDVVGYPEESDIRGSTVYK